MILLAQYIHVPASANLRGLQIKRFNMISAYERFCIFQEPKRDTRTQQADKLTSEIFVHNARHWALYYVWFQNIFELYACLFPYNMYKNNEIL